MSSRKVRQTPPVISNKGKLTIFVSTCQKNQEEKFPAVIPVKSRVLAIQRFLLDQWMISENDTFLDIPLSEHMYCFRGRGLRLDKSIDIYDIQDQDTIYLRFASFGKITCPFGMSTEELREELVQRKAYKKNSSPEYLMQILQNIVLKETRIRRLQAAVKEDDKESASSIKHELKTMEKKMKKQTNQEKSILDARSPRKFFLSIIELEQIYLDIPRAQLDNSILIFDVDRNWVFGSQNAIEKKRFDCQYMTFCKDFIDMLILKEEANQIFWFRPEKSYRKLSNFLCQTIDLVTGVHYLPLQLKPAAWQSLGGTNGWEGKGYRTAKKYKFTLPKYTKSVSRILTNLSSSSFDYVAVKELLYQSNQTIDF